MNRPEQAGRGDAGNVPAIVAAGIHSHVRDRFRVLADKAMRGGVSA